MSKLVAAVSLLAITSCSHIQYIDTPDKAFTVAKDFEKVFAQVELAMEAQLLSEQQAAEWMMFREKFQAVYVISSQLYKAALLTDDEALVQVALDTVSLLVPELFKWANLCGIKLEALDGRIIK